METPKSVDLTNVSFDEFVAFLFDHDIDHEIPPESEKYDPWYFHVEVEFDAKNIGAYYVRMFEQPEFLLARFTKAQLEEGFWAIQGPNLNCSVSRIIENQTYPYPSERNAFVPCPVCSNAFSLRNHLILRSR